MAPPPVGISGYLIQVTGPDRAALLDYAVAQGHGVEIADFADSDLLDDPAQVAELVAWYGERLPAVRGPVSLHGAYHNLQPGARDTKIREATRDRVRQCLDLAAHLGARSIVFHSDFDLVPTPGRVAAWAERAGAFWRDTAAGYDLDVLLENAAEPDPRVLLTLIEAVGLPRVGLCFDTGHAHLLSTLWARATGQPSEPLGDWLDVLGAHVCYLHVSDNNATWDQHAAPGQGGIDWPGLLAALARRPRPLPAVIEVAGLDGAQETEQYLSQLAPRV